MTDAQSITAFEQLAEHLHALREQRESITQRYDCGELSKQEALQLLAVLIYELAAPEMNTRH